MIAFIKFNLQHLHSFGPLLLPQYQTAGQAPPMIETFGLPEGNIAWNFRDRISQNNIPCSCAKAR